MDPGRNVVRYEDAKSGARQHRLKVQRSLSEFSTKDGLDPPCVLALLGGFRV